MCELLGVCVEHPVRLRLGWEEFALRGSRRGGNPDGWGVAYFAHHDALLLREPGPAAASPMVTFLARHAPPSKQIISHVRNATTGARSLENTQPFVRRLAGRAHVFAHNGHVPGMEIPAGRPYCSRSVKRTRNDSLRYCSPTWKNCGDSARRRSRSDCR
jgi:glutamine amidotransferase